MENSKQQNRNNEKRIPFTLSQYINAYKIPKLAETRFSRPLTHNLTRAIVSTHADIDGYDQLFRA